MSNTDYNPPITGGPFQASQVCEIHKQLIEACLAIGYVAEMAQWASMDLAERIAASHPAVTEMTVGELIRLAEGRS